MMSRWLSILLLWGTLLSMNLLRKEVVAQDRFQPAEWKHSGSLWLLTTAEGAALPAGSQVEQFPLLIRLHRDYFDFAQAQPLGEDLRFTTSDGFLMASQVDAWDVQSGQASIWVLVPKIVGDARQEIKLYWGNPKAKASPRASEVFQASHGYLSVWHMNQGVEDEVGTLSTVDTGTTTVAGVIGAARHFGDRKGIFGGDKITSYPIGANSHSTELWFRAERPNATLIGWGNEQAQGKAVMQFRSPPHLRMDCYFSGGNVDGSTQVPLGQWTHVVHTYREGESKLYINGKLDSTNTKQGGPLNIRTPARLYMGGWYNNYDFQGDLDEVRVSNVVRSAEWIHLQYENQKLHPSLVGHVVTPGKEFEVTPNRIELAEGQKAKVTVKAGGAQKIVWSLKRDGVETVVATDRFEYEFDAGRVPHPSSKAVPLSKNPSDAAPINVPITKSTPSSVTLCVKAIYEKEVSIKEIAITIRDDLPEPEFTLNAPLAWNGREEIEIIPEITNLESLRSKGVDQLNYHWSVEGIAVAKKELPGRLLLRRAQGSGDMLVHVAIDNGGAAVTRACRLRVQEPTPSKENWLLRPISEKEQPENDQFIACERGKNPALRHGRLVYAGSLEPTVDRVFVRVFADNQLYKSEKVKIGADGRYKLEIPVQAALVKYRTEFGSITGDRETILHSASNIVCGDAFLIVGQSNAVATDFGKENSLASTEWVRTYGATTTDPKGSRWQSWGNAEARNSGGKSEIGYWGLELGRRLVESEKIPICIVNGAQGGTRIDQHQRSQSDPTDPNTIYGRLLWRVQQAKLTHGIRGIIWHQGENDQGADGPTGGFGYETYRQYFVDLAASWKEDYPNVEHYYVFQIWPKACAMGIRGSDNRLREVQRRLPELFSQLSVLPTLGIQPPGGCHFPAAGYAEFAKLLHPMMRYHIYHRFVDSFEAPNLKRAYFASPRREEIHLEFNQIVVWSDRLVSQFHLEGEPKQVVSGSDNSNTIVLKLKGPTSSNTITYLDSAGWSPDNLLLGKNGLPAFSFCEVPIEPH